MAKTFTLRVDLESDKGIRQGLPKLLNLLKKHDIKASFYIPMGGESNILEILQYSRSLKHARETKVKVWSLLDKIRMASFPRDFVKSNIKILRKIISEGHELGIHGWKHREWTRGLSKINIRNRIRKSKIKYIKLFGTEPISFAAPGFNTNENVLKILEENNIQYIGDFQGKKTKKYGKLKNIPITILGNDKMPIIEYLVGKGASDQEILEYIKKEIGKNSLNSLYIHGLFEARFKLELLDEIFSFIKNKKLKIKRIIDY